MTAFRARVVAIAAAWMVAGVASVQCRAQELAADPLTLETAMARALTANPEIAAARLVRGVNLAGLAVAGERPNPEASIEITRETPRQAFALSWPVELGGKRAKRLAVSQAALGTGDAELEAAIVQVRNEVRRNYFGTVTAAARLTILRELREVAQRARATAQTRFERGDAPRLEVIQADLALNTADAEVIAAAGAVTAARASLNAVLALPLDATQPLTTPMDAGGEIVLSAAVERARAGSANLMVLDRGLDQQRARAALARALRVPDVAPTATLTHGAQPEFTYGWRASLAITLPLLTTHKAGVAVEDATLAQLVAQRQAALSRIVGEVTAAAAAAEAQRQTYLRYRDAIVPQARQVEEMAQESYRLGQTGLAALLQALQASRDIRLRALDAGSQFQTGLADLERAIGAPLP